MGTKKVLIALFAMLIFLSKSSFSNDPSRAFRDVKGNRLDNVRVILEKDNSLLNKQFKVMGRDGKLYRVTLLCVAATKGLYEMVKLLLTGGADTNLIDSVDGDLSPLASAVFWGFMHKHITNVYPLDSEYPSNYEKIIEVLLKYGANPNGMWTDNSCLFYRVAEHSLSKVICILLKYGANPLKEYVCEELKKLPKVMFSYPREDFLESERLLKLAQEKQRYIEDILSGKTADSLVPGEAITDNDIPVCAKLKILTYLLNREGSRNFPTEDKIRNYYRQIPFAYLFFSNDTILGFALKNRHLRLVDSQGKTVEEAMELCAIPKIIPTIFGSFRDFHKNRNLKELFEVGRHNSRPGQVADLWAKILAKMVKRARRVGRKDFESEFYRVFADCNEMGWENYCLARNQEEFEESEQKQQHVEDVLPGQTFNLQVLDTIMLNENISDYAKLEPLALLLKNKERCSVFLTDDKIKKYYRQIKFNDSFFSDSTLLGFALENSHIQFVDLEGKTFEESMESCYIPEIIPTIFSVSRSFWKIRRLRELVGIKNHKRARRYLNVEQEKYAPLAKILVRMIKKAKIGGKKNFVSEYYRTYANYNEKGWEHNFLERNQFK